MSNGEAQLAQAKGCVNVELLSSSRKLIKLLIAVDCFPHGELGLSSPVWLAVVKAREIQGFQCKFTLMLLFPPSLTD
jgi:hypothetical protein